MANPVRIKKESDHPSIGNIVMQGIPAFLCVLYWRYRAHTVFFSIGCNGGNKICPALTHRIQPDHVSAHIQFYVEAVSTFVYSLGHGGYVPKAVLPLHAQKGLVQKTVFFVAHIAVQIAEHRVPAQRSKDNKKYTALPKCRCKPSQSPLGRREAEPSASSLLAASCG